MDTINKKFISTLLALILGVSSLIVTTPSFALDSEDASASGMVLDAVVVRPMGIVGTALGTVFFVGSLPFTILSGNVGEAADTLVVKPARYTFMRPLGED